MKSTRIVVTIEKTESPSILAMLYVSLPCSVEQSRAMYDRLIALCGSESGAERLIRIARSKLSEVA